MSDPFASIEVKRLAAESGDDDESGIPDEIKDMLMSALKDTGAKAQRARCLSMALKMPMLTGAAEAIGIAEEFHKYISEGVK